MEKPALSEVEWDPRISSLPLSHILAIAVLCMKQYPLCAIQAV